MHLLFRSAPTPGPDGLLVRVTPESAGWQFIHFAAYRLAPGQVLPGHTGGNETALVVLGGRCTVAAGPATYPHIGGRRDVWERVPPYVVLLPPGVPYQVEAEAELHLAVAAAPAPPGGAPRLITPDQITAEERGEGCTYRYIHHLLPPRAPAARLLLVEVYTPAGHWSSFPPHKHDTEDPPREAYLEEVYYHLVNPPEGFAFQRVYTGDGALDQSLAVANGDVVLVPRGYHPVAAMPGYDLYYLNVMAGYSRSWNFQVDPRYQHLLNWSKHPAMAGEESR